MSDTNRPSLWRTMEMSTGACPEWQHIILALRDWLVPEDEEPSEHLFDGDSNPQWDQWKQRLRALLTAEADRAERGDE